MFWLLVHDRIPGQNKGISAWSNDYLPIGHYAYVI